MRFKLALYRGLSIKICKYLFKLVWGLNLESLFMQFQVGLPSDKEQYIHRLGRTGRKGKEGQGILLLAPWEEFFLSTVKDLPITKAEAPLIDPETRKKVSVGNLSALVSFISCPDLREEFKELLNKNNPNALWDGKNTALSH